MDVNRTNYQAAPPPSTETGDFAPAPAPVQATPAPAQIDVQAYVRAVAESPYSSSEAPDTLPHAINEINTSIAMHSRHLSVSFHEATGRRMVTVYDSVTNEPIREIPPQQVLDAHASILELAGLFVNTRG
jgi:flagellar protein FlaG